MPQKPAGLLGLSDARKCGGGTVSFHIDRPNGRLLLHRVDQGHHQSFLQVSEMVTEAPPKCQVEGLYRARTSGE